jgi:hypothetical protein
VATIGNCGRRAEEVEMSAIPDIGLKDLPKVCNCSLQYCAPRVEPAPTVSNDAGFSTVSPDPHMIGASNSPAARRTFGYLPVPYRASRLPNAALGVCEGSGLSKWRITPSKLRPFLRATSVDV